MFKELKKHENLSSKSTTVNEPAIFLSVTPQQRCAHCESAASFKVMEKMARNYYASLGPKLRWPFPTKPFAAPVSVWTTCVSLCFLVGKKSVGKFSLLDNEKD